MNYIILPTMSNSTLCNVYTLQHEKAIEALTKALETGKAYKIAGRSKENYELAELESIVDNLQAKMKRYCNGNGGIKTRRIVPL